MTPAEHYSWAQAQICQASPRRNGPFWETACPVCGDFLYSRTVSGLWRSLERHLMVAQPVGLEHLQREPGDGLAIGGERYEVILRFRPYASCYYHKLRSHTFALVVRRLWDGRLFRTSSRRPGMVEQIAWSRYRALGLEPYGPRGRF